MSSDDITSYFGSYTRKSPIRAEFMTELGLLPHQKGFPTNIIQEKMNSEGQPRYIEVRQDNYPKLYEALIEECEFRGIESPACYIDTEKNNKYPIAYARADLEAIFFAPDTYTQMNKDELRAGVAHEVKHLYSGIPQSNKEMRQIEKDCDRASIESTSYKTVQSYVHKAMAIMVDKKVSVPAFRQFIHRFNETFPNVIAENFWLRLDSEHPSPGRRMHEMRKHEQNLNRQNGAER